MTKYYSNNFIDTICHTFTPRPMNDSIQIFDPSHSFQISVICQLMQSKRDYYDRLQVWFVDK